MQDVIHQVMEAENEAKQILQEARTEAERLLSEARRQARANDEQARTEVRRTADELIENAVKAAEDKKAAQLARAVQEMESSVLIDDQLRRFAVAAVVDCVAGKNQTG
ncbi:MAG: hypothetical protein PWQ29_603 [Verrucomicrobiota bacterium]|jgi:vacuolar-type H+-ATPase subunit H|nr:hypothetical protein [Verrucomicrobiota bacterium]MDK2963209.1 hypothetical protein [Verrucomicrobiota bacterium]